MTLMGKTLALGMLALALVAGVACSPAKPATPSFAADVEPIFGAHCNRCHNSAGLQGDPSTGKKPVGCKFDFYEGDPATCAPDGGAVPIACWGAKYCSANLPVSVYIKGQGDPMPPPPAPLLNDWELDVVERWIANPIP